jgi:hypothetical protein
MGRKAQEKAGVFAAQGLLLEKCHHLKRVINIYVELLKHMIALLGFNSHC